MKSAKLLYQLKTDKPLDKDTYVEINGPYDKYGVVQASTQRQVDSKWINLVRGCESKNIKPQYKF